jgi:hypothetical protein
VGNLLGIVGESDTLVSESREFHGLIVLLLTERLREEIGANQQRTPSTRNHAPRVMYPARDRSVPLVTARIEAAGRSVSGRKGIGRDAFRCRDRVLEPCGEGWEPPGHPSSYIYGGNLRGPYTPSSFSTSLPPPRSTVAHPDERHARFESREEERSCRLYRVLWGFSVRVSRSGLPESCSLSLPVVPKLPSCLRMRAKKCRLTERGQVSYAQSRNDPVFSRT